MTVYQEIKQPVTKGKDNVIGYYEEEFPLESTKLMGTWKVTVEYGPVIIGYDGDRQILRPMTQVRNNLPGVAYCLFIGY